MKIKTSPQLYFHQALGVVHKFPPYNKLSKSELLVLGELMLCAHLGYKPLLNDESRKLVMTNLSLSTQVFKNILSSLRSNGILIENNIPEKYLIKYLTPFNFEFYE